MCHPPSSRPKHPKIHGKPMRPWTQGATTPVIKLEPTSTCTGDIATGSSAERRGLQSTPTVPESITFGVSFRCPPSSRVKTPAAAAGDTPKPTPPLAAPRNAHHRGAVVAVGVVVSFVVGSGSAGRSGGTSTFGGGSGGDTGA